ncbi:MAG: hypothetical protein SFX18_18065 [Pirellulales bacterium]|nr:hypothetical protein [Pirellulales bacterium]
MANSPKLAPFHSGGAFTTPRQERAVLWLVAGMCSLGLLSLLPGLVHTGSGFAPQYARVVMLVGLWQLGLAIWQLTIPDWTTLRISMVAYAILATAYGAIFAVCLVTPAEKQLFWDLTEIRGSALPWCGGMVVLTLFLAYACGMVGSRWRRQLQKAIRQAAVGPRP